MSAKEEVKKAHAKALVAIISAIPDISIEQAAKIVDTTAALVLETLRSHLEDEEETE
jgi:hypothetical protein